MAIFDPETILSAFNDRGTLLLYLKSIEKKLDELLAANVPSGVKTYLLEFDIPYVNGPGDTHLSSAVLPNGKTVLTVYQNGYAEADLMLSYDAVGSGKIYFTGFSYDAEAGEYYYTTCRAIYTAWEYNEGAWINPLLYSKTFPEDERPDITIIEGGL